MVQVLLSLLLLLGLLLGISPTNGLGQTTPAPEASVTPTPNASSSPTPSASPTSEPPAESVTVTLPVSSFGRMVVDDHSNRVFISSPASNSIVVLGFDGTVLGQVQNEAGANAMVISGNNLYVTLLNSGAIDVIDLTSLKRVKTLATGLINPNDLVLAGGSLWTTSGDCGSWSVQLASVNLSSGAVKRFSAPQMLSYCTAFAPTNPLRPNLILGWSLGLSPATVATLDVSTGRPVAINDQREDALGNLRDVAITPDGKNWIAASGAPYKFLEFSVSTLAQDGVVYPAQPYPVAVAVSAAHGGVMVGGVSSSSTDDAYEYAIGSPGQTLTTHQNNPNVATRGLAFSADASRVFEVGWDHATTVTFSVFPGA